VIAGFRREVDEKHALLGYYAASSGNFLPTFRNNLSGSIFMSQESKKKADCPNTDFILGRMSAVGLLLDTFPSWKRAAFLILSPSFCFLSSPSPHFTSMPTLDLFLSSFFLPSFIYFFSYFFFPIFFVS